MDFGAIFEVIALGMFFGAMAFVIGYAFARALAAFRVVSGGMSE